MGIIGTYIKCMDSGAEGNVECGSPISRRFQIKFIMAWPREHSCDNLSKQNQTKNVAHFVFHIHVVNKVIHLDSLEPTHPRFVICFRDTPTANFVSFSPFSPISDALPSSSPYPFFHTLPRYIFHLPFWEIFKHPPLGPSYLVILVLLIVAWLYCTLWLIFT